MKKLLPHFVKLLFGVFILAVVAAVMFYSFQGLGLIFKNDLLGQLFGMVLFDIASIVWFFVFISACASTMQYIFSGIGFLLGIGGTLGLVGIEVGLSSGMLAAGTMQKTLTYIFIAALIGHLILIYAHHVSEPTIAAKISLGVDKAMITDKAKDDATEYLTNNLPQLSRPIAQRLIQEVYKDLNLQPAHGVMLDLPALEVVDSSYQGGLDLSAMSDLPAQEVVNSPAETSQNGKLAPLDFLKAWFGKKKEEPRVFEHAAPAPLQRETNEKPLTWTQARERWDVPAQAVDLGTVTLKPEPVQTPHSEPVDPAGLIYHPVGMQEAAEETPKGEDAPFRDEANTA